jgi:purine-binding chemotaxis protein CheW
VRARQRTAPAGQPPGTPVLTVQVAGRAFALDLLRVEQVLDFRPPTPTPRRLPFIEGVIEHRGRFLAVASLRKRLGVSEAGPPHAPIVVLTGVGQDGIMALVVDQVLRVVSLPADGVLPPPPRVLGIRAEFIRGVANAGGHPVVWLEAAKLLTSLEPVTLVA